VIVDSQGFNQTVYFSRPENVYIFVRVRRDYYSEESYPADGDEQIKDNIVDWSVEAENINIGVDVIRQRLSTPIYEVPGVGDIEIALDSSTTLPYTPTYAESNIVIDGRQLAVFAASRIVVEDIP
jgi:hypothetical protein